MTTRSLDVSGGKSITYDEFVRYAMQTVPTHALVGGGVALTYAFLRELMRHHQETLKRPKVIDHLIACTLIGSIGSLLVFNGSIGGLLLNGAVVGNTLGLMIWWASMQGMPGSHMQQANIVYENNVTEDEVARFQALD